jgi:RNA-directed DNA polymerase
VDGASAFYVEQRYGVQAFLADLRLEVKTATFQPLPVRERMIPKVGGKQRRLGIATVRDRVVQGRVETGVGTDLGGGLSALLLRVPAPAACS